MTGHTVEPGNLHQTLCVDDCKKTQPRAIIITIFSETRETRRASNDSSTSVNLLPASEKNVLPCHDLRF